MSPLKLVQERVSRDLHYPWRVITCCALLNQTSGAQVRPILAELFERRLPTPSAVFTSPILDLLEPLGLQNRRLVLLVRMAEDYLGGAEADDCYGVGRYGRDALALFRDGRIDLEPADHWLRPYLEWRRSDELNNKPVRWDRAGHADWRAGLGAVR